MFNTKIYEKFEGTGGGRWSEDAGRKPKAGGGGRLPPLPSRRNGTAPHSMDKGDGTENLPGM